MAVDSAQLLVQNLLSIGNHVVDFFGGALGLVATLGNDFAVVGRTTTVPGEDLEGNCQLMIVWKKKKKKKS